MSAREIAPMRRLNGHAWSPDDGRAPVNCGECGRHTTIKPGDPVLCAGCALQKKPEYQEMLAEQNAPTLKSIREASKARAKARGGFHYGPKKQQ